MTTLGIFSYTLLFFVFILNTLKNVPQRVVLSVFYIILTSYFVFAIYFTTLMNHSFFPIVALLLYTSFYNLLLFKTKHFKIENIFLYAGYFILPMLLINSVTLWSQFTFIVLLEGLRLVETSKPSVKGTNYSLLNFVNINYKVFIMGLAFITTGMSLGDVVLGQEVMMKSNLIILPLVLMYLLANIYIGGFNSVVVERENLKKFKSKNILLQFYVFKFIIPFIFIFNIKNIIKNLDFATHEYFMGIIIALSVIMLLLYIKRYMQIKDTIYRLVLIMNIMFITLNIAYLNSSSLGDTRYILIGSLILLIITLTTVVTNYKVFYKKSILTVLNLIIFMTPVSPLFYVLLSEVEGVDRLSSVATKLVMFFSLIVLNIFFYDRIREINKIKVRNINVYAFQRVVYLTLGVIACFGYVIYDKV